MLNKDNQVVIHVLLGNTTIKPVKRLNQLLVKVAMSENTKTNRVNPLAKHVTVVLTALLVRQVVRILQLLVLLEPMPVGQLPFVIHVLLGNTTTKQVKRLNQFLVKVVLMENTKTKREKHPATMIV